MSERELRNEEYTDGAFGSRSHDLSRRSLLICAPLVRVLMGLGRAQDATEHQPPARMVEVTHTCVFAAGPHGGNPCPVVLSADHLESGEMQSLSQKFGLDTVFILAPQSKDADIRLRYFVPQHEMGVSGHATIAAITVAMRDGRLESEQIRIETLNGIFQANAVRGEKQLLVTLEQNRPAFGPAVPASMVAAALKIDIEKFVTATPIQSVSVSRPKLLVPLCDSKVLNALEPDFNALWTLCEAFRVSGVSPFTRNTDKANIDTEARQFPLRAGFPEDAATGVAAAALGAYLVHYDCKCRAGAHRLRIAQGYAMGSPSLIEALIDCDAGSITRTRIRGTADIIRREFFAI